MSELSHRGIGGGKGIQVQIGIVTTSSSPGYIVSIPVDFEPDLFLLFPYQPSGSTTEYGASLLNFIAYDARNTAYTWARYGNYTQEAFLSSRAHETHYFNGYMYCQYMNRDTKLQFSSNFPMMWLSIKGLK